jgi:hypothetical protein
LPYTLNQGHTVGSYLNHYSVKTISLSPFAEKCHELTMLLSLPFSFGYLFLEQHHWTQKRKEGAVLWLEDVQSAVKQVSDEIRDAKVGMSLQSQYLHVCGC